MDKGGTGGTKEGLEGQRGLDECNTLKRGGKNADCQSSCDAE